MLDHDAALDETRPDDDNEKMREVHKRAMKRFRAAVEPQLLVRTYSFAARRISIIPGAIWEGEYGESFDKAVKLDIHKLGKAIRKAENDYRQNRIVPDFRPAGGSSDNETADTLDGMHRADGYFFKSQQARDNAFSEASRGGFGAYRLTTEWADPLDKDNDEQRINPGLTIVDADQSVFFDPDSKLYDKSDARYAFVLTGHSPDAFKDEYGDEQEVSWPEGRSIWWGDWYRPDQVLVAEYYEIEERNERLLIYTHPLIPEEEQRHWERELDPEDREELEAKGWVAKVRRIKRRRCHKYILSGVKVLEDQGLTTGGNIPIVPVYGNRDYVDGVEWFVGVLPSSKIDAARLYAAMVSNLAEIQAMAPYERPIFAPEQMPPNLADMWARGNVDRHPYALVNPLRNEDGTIAVPGRIDKVEAPAVPQTLAALLEIANRDVTEDDQDGAEEVRANTSAEAMDIAAARVDAKTGVLLDNMRQSVQREGELYLDMCREVYVEDGREVETMTEDGDDGIATLNEDYLDGDVLKVRNDFATGRYKVIASVTEATATRRDRTVKQMLGMAEIATQAQDQQGAQAAWITAIANMDGEGLEEIQKWNRRRGLALGLFEPTEDEQQEMEQQAQSQQPDPAAMVAMGQAKALEAGAAKDAAEAEAVGVKATAEAEEKRASAALKIAQAQAVGGPESAPEAPSGLSAANDQAQTEERFASAELKRAQAANLRHGIDDRRLKTGAEIAQMERQANG